MKVCFSFIRVQCGCVGGRLPHATRAPSILWSSTSQGFGALGFQAGKEVKHEGSARGFYGPLLTFSLVQNQSRTTPRCKSGGKCIPGATSHFTEQLYPMERENRSLVGSQSFYPTRLGYVESSHDSLVFLFLTSSYYSRTIDPVPPSSPPTSSEPRMKFTHIFQLIYRPGCLTSHPQNHP